MNRAKAWYFRSLAHRKGFTDEDFEEGRIYEATLLEGNEPIEDLAKHLQSCLEAVHGKNS